MPTPKTLLGTPCLVPQAPGEDGYAAEGNFILCKLIDAANGLGSLLNTVIVPLLSGTSTTLTAGGTLTPTHPLHKINGSPGAVTIAAIAAGATDGQLLTIQGGANAVTIQANATGVQLESDIVLAQYHELNLRWDSTLAKWVERGRSFPNQRRNQGALDLFEARAGGSNKISIRAPAALGGDYILTLPDALGSGGYFLVAADGTVTFNTGSATLDGAYDGGRTITVDAGKVLLDGTGSAVVEPILKIIQAAAANAYEIEKGAGAGAALKFINTGSGADVEGSGATWAISKAGVATIVRMLVAVGSGTDPVIDITNGGTGPDIDGHGSTWQILKTGEAKLNSITGPASAWGVTAAGIATLPQMWAKGRPWFDVRAYGAVGDDATDDTAAIAAAIAAAVSAGKGQVYIPEGVYRCNSTIAVPSYIRIFGAGPRVTFVKFYGAGYGFTLNGTQYSGIHSMTIGLQPACTVGLRLSNNGATSNVSYNSFSGIEIWGSALTSGQIGLYMASDALGDATFNHFSDFKIYSVDRPIYLNDDEANVFVSFQIDTFGTGAAGYGVETYSHADQFLGFWFGRGISTATSLQCFKGTPDNSIIEGVADVGTGQLFNLTGSTGHNVVRGQVVGSTIFGIYGDIVATGFGSDPEWAENTYELNVMGKSGVNRDLFKAGIKSVTDGLTIQYIHATGRMKYILDGGDVYIGTSLIRSGSGTPEGAITAPIGSIYLRTNGGAGTTFYVKETGSGDTGWIGK